MKIYDGRDDLRGEPTDHTLRVTSCGHLLGDGQDRMTLRRMGRKDYSLFFCERGRIFFQEGTLAAGQIWIYPAHIEQKYTVLSKDGTAYFYLHFTGADVPMLLSSLGISPLIPLRVKQPQIASAAFADIQSAIFSGGVKGALAAEAHALRLLAELAPEEASPAHPYVLRHVIDRMAHTFAEEYSPALYAQMIGVSESRFLHLFREAIGVSPYAYVLSLRIENAKELLAKTDRRVKEVASLCGFCDPLYFAQAFRKKTGLSPLAYRKAHRS